MGNWVKGFLGKVLGQAKALLGGAEAPRTKGQARTSSERPPAQDIPYTRPAPLTAADIAAQKATEDKWTALFANEPQGSVQQGGATTPRPQTAEDIARVARIKARQRGITGQPVGKADADTKSGGGSGMIQLKREIPFGSDQEDRRSADKHTPPNDETEQREREEASAALTRRVEEQTRNQQQVEQMLRMQGNGSVASPNDPEREKRKLKFFEDNQPTPVRGDPKHTHDKPRTFSR